MRSQEDIANSNLEWLKVNDDKMKGDTFSFYNGYKMTEIKRINGIWTLIQ